MRCCENVPPSGATVKHYWAYAWFQCIKHYVQPFLREKFKISSEAVAKLKIRRFYYKLYFHFILCYSDKLTFMFTHLTDAFIQSYVKKLGTIQID